IATEILRRSHGLFSFRLNFENIDPAIGCPYVEEGFAVRLVFPRSGGTAVGICDRHTMDFKGSAVECGPRRWIRIETSHKINYIGTAVVPVDRARLLKDLRRFLQFNILRLGQRGIVTGGDSGHRLQHKLRTSMAELVVQGAGGIVFFDLYFFLENNTACVDLVADEESGRTCFLFAVDDGPVDGRRTTVLGKEGCVEVDGA